MSWPWIAIRIRHLLVFPAGHAGAPSIARTGHARDKNRLTQRAGGGKVQSVSHGELRRSGRVRARRECLAVRDTCPPCAAPPGRPPLSGSLAGAPPTAASAVSIVRVTRRERVFKAV